MERCLTTALRAYQSQSPRKRRAIFHGAYFILTAALFLLAIGLLLLKGRSPMWTVDGFKQHFPFMTYIGQWLREAVSALFCGQAVPTFDFSLGYGADALQSLNYYGLGDPLLLLAALFPPERAEICYILLIFLRYYLAGAAFLAYAKHMGIPRRYALPGALAYAFSMYMVFQCTTRHPFFANPLIHLPLFFLGAEKALKKESPACLIFSVAWSAACGFYFLYVNSLLLLVYALFRHFGLEKEHPWRRLPANAGRLIGFYCVGLLIAAAVFLPGALGYLSSARVSSGRVGNLLTYAKDVYVRFLPSLFTYNGLAIYPCMPALGGFAAMVVLRSRARAYRSWKWAFVLSLLFALVPFFGYAFNGFSYVASRWQYGALFLLCVGLSLGFPGLLRLERRDKWFLAAFSLLFLVYCLVLYRLRKMETVLLLVAAASVLISVTVVLFLNLRRVRKRAALCYAVSMVLLLGNLLGFHAMVEANSILKGTAVKLGEAYQRATDSPIALAPECAQGEFWRVDASQNDASIVNEGILLNQNTTLIYNSILPQSVYESSFEMQNSGLTNVSRVGGLNSRASLEALWSVKYFARNAGGVLSARVPYGFSLVKTQGDYELYENQYALPFGYTTDAYITREEYEALPALQKQWALLQGAVLAEEDARYRRIQPEQSLVEIDVATEDTDTARWDGEVLEVTRKIASLRLQLEGIPNAETYVELVGFDVRLAVNVSGAGLMTGEGLDYQLIPTKTYRQGIPRRDFLLNAGYCEEAQKEMDLYVYYASSHDLSDIRVYCQPMDRYAEYIEALRQEPLENLSFSANRVCGEISLSRDKILVLSLPYMPGWSAEVDGEKAELFASGADLTALKLEAGEHSIELTYETPGLKLGLCLSLAGLAIFAGIAIYRRKRRP